MTQHPPPPNGGVLWCAEHVELRRAQNKTFLVHASDGRGLVLNEMGAAIAERLSAPTTIPTVCEGVLAAFDIEPDECADVVERFVGDLRARGLVDGYEGPAADAALRRRYLDLLMKALVNLIYPEHELRMEHLAENGVTGDRVTDDRTMRDIATTHAERLGELVEAKIVGRLWQGRITSLSHSMVGLRRLQSLERCAARVFADRIPGDFLEAGVCQGGAAIFLRALQVVYDEGHRSTWLADSFAGLPAPEHPKDVAEGLNWTEAEQPWLAVSMETVQKNFRTYDLLSDQVRFLPGWFSDTLPDAPVDSLAILRVDADLYESTFDALDALYDKVSAGGYVVIDDYSAIDACRRAVDDFRSSRGIDETLSRVDVSAVLWRRKG